MNAETTAYAIKLLHSQESGLTKIPVDSSCSAGDYCIITTPFGRDLARVMGVPSNQNEIRELPEWPFSRPADASDMDMYRKNLVKEQEALSVCKDLVIKHKLAMNLVAAHYVLHDARLLFYFTAENRVDFRALISDLIPNFKTRIELRQIGVREESRFVGGLGVCGRPFCCNAVSDKLRPVSIKMAKTQNLSVTSSKISGACGRLLCCLNFEYEAYAEEGRRFPNVGTRVSVDGERCMVCDVNILARRVTLSSPDGGRRHIPVCKLRFDRAERLWQVNDCSCSGCGGQQSDSALPAIHYEES